MELESESSELVGFSPQMAFLGHLRRKVAFKVVGFLQKVKNIGKDDPRRIAHSLKVGLALTLVSAIYYVTPLFSGFGGSTMWAVLTVVVVMEYTVGATLCKGLNRAFATLLAGALGVGAHQVAVHCGEKGEPILLGVFVFLLAAAATFSRFIPEIKAKYDYGVTIFILTFCLVAVSSYRVDELIQLAHKRLSTIAIGVSTCLCTSMFVFPVWAGEELHLLIAGNLDKLASFLQGLESEYFGEKASENLENKPFLQVYKSVLNSKATEETLFNFVRWEPSHGRFHFRQPWQQYLKIGAFSRRCASTMEALANYIYALPKTKSQTDPDIQTACRKMSSESSRALRELSEAIRDMKAPAVANTQCNMSATVDRLRVVLAEVSDTALPDNILHVATVASLLIELVGRVQEISNSVEELARLAHFKRSETDHKAIITLVETEQNPANVTIQLEN